MPKQGSSTKSKSPNGNSGVYGVMVGLSFLANTLAIIYVWMELSKDYNVF